MKISIFKKLLSYINYQSNDFLKLTGANATMKMLPQYPIVCKHHECCLQEHLAMDLHFYKPLILLLLITAVLLSHVNLLWIYTINIMQWYLQPMMKIVQIQDILVLCKPLPWLFFNFLPTTSIFIKACCLDSCVAAPYNWSLKGTLVRSKGFVSLKPRDLCAVNRRA